MSERQDSPEDLEAQQFARRQKVARRFKKWAAIAVPTAALLAAVSLFLPAVSFTFSGQSGSVSFFGGTVMGEAVADTGGPFLLVAFLLTAAIGATAVVLDETWATIATAILGLPSGLFGLGAGLNILANSISEPGFSASASIGAYLVFLFGTIVAAASIVAALPDRA